jgi:DNA repair exonuclease SbcCD ATPase subunit
MQNARGRGAFRLPQQFGSQRQVRSGRAAQDPVGNAISAMGRAVDQLQDKRPGDALAHEMAALQGLLQAQAEIRRREVAQQSGAAAGGSGRQGQDLSALFDKELQRQQRTNYETRSQLEERQERGGETALDRIRELARRQEELSKRQRDLANRSLPAEERKRHLEELTREQNALRAQADEMARQSNSGDMRGASERMRSAATELERQDPGSAADRAAQAAESLRQLEQQMRSDSPEGRQRAAGELRMEAQQIASEQRRIASEAGRLERGTGAADADGWRRLAGEKDKLADRVEELQRSAEQLASGQKQTEGSQSPKGEMDTARELQQQRIADRMRVAAEEMRAAAGAKPGGQGRDLATREEQIARDLDRVVDRLNAGNDRAEDLSRELDQAQALRNRLDSLERRLREAEAKAASGRPTSGRSGAPAGRNPADQNSKELQQLREEYAKELQRTQAALSQLERGAPGSGLGGISPEGHEWSVTDQGTEAFKQDFSQWQALRKDVDSALERYEASIVARASRKSLQDRLSGGGSDRAPDAYRRLIARYYESLARKK